MVCVLWVDGVQDHFYCVYSSNVNVYRRKLFFTTGIIFVYCVLVTICEILILYFSVCHDVDK